MLVVHKFVVLNKQITPISCWPFYFHVAELSFLRKHKNTNISLPIYPRYILVIEHISLQNSQRGRCIYELEDSFF